MKVLLSVRKGVAGIWRVRQIVEQQMRLDNETNASQLCVLLSGMGYHLNLRTILRCRTSLDWTFRGSTYSQFICEPNKQKTLEFSWEHQNDDLANVVFMDECSVQLESHWRRYCRKQGEPVKNKFQPVSLHCKLLLMSSGGIFPQGKTSSEGSHVGWNKYVWEAGQVSAYLKASWMPQSMWMYWRKHCCHSSELSTQMNIVLCRIMHPKHASRLGRHFLETNEVTLWKTPPESPDL